MLEELLHREPAVGVYRLDFQCEELLFLEVYVVKPIRTTEAVWEEILPAVVPRDAASQILSPSCG